MANGKRIGRVGSRTSPVTVITEYGDPDAPPDLITFLQEEEAKERNEKFEQEFRGLKIAVGIVLFLLLSLFVIMCIGLHRISVQGGFGVYGN